jgi:hypothetical protein
MVQLPLLTTNPPVITEVLAEDGLKAYLVGFNFNNYRWGDFIDEVSDVIVEFAFGRHKKTLLSDRELRRRLVKAAKAIYSVPEFAEAADLYLHGKCISDDDETKSYLKRGEFGELLLHLILTDYCGTIPLICKIFFKDSNDATVHGFDAVHIEEKTNTMWLGESKLYFEGKKGVKKLVDDLVEHFKEDYLNNEFTLIEKKIPEGDLIPKRDHWINLLNDKRTLGEKLKYIKIPVLCTYTSPVFSKFPDENSKEFKEAYAREIEALRTQFLRTYNKKVKHDWKGSMEIILLLFPVKCKNAFVCRMHNKLYHMQRS